MSHPHDSSPFAMRLKQGRVMRRLSLRDLSEKLNQAVSHAALAKYEQGVMQPSSEVLSKISAALDLPHDFFFRPIGVSIEKVSFRKRKSFGSKDTAAILENIRSRLEDYLLAEELVGAPSKFERQFSNPDNDSADSIRAFARQVRVAWGLGEQPIPNLVQLLENRGIRVVEIDEPSRKFDGCQIDGLNAIAIGHRINLPVARKRFTIAHELGHVLLNDWMKGLDIPEKERDKKMDVFAAEFLLPEKALRQYFSGSRTSISLEEVVRLKIRYVVSLAMIIYSLKTFKLIGENAYTRFQIHFGSKWRSAGEEPADDELKDDEHASRFRRLVLQGVSEGTVSLSRGAGLLGISLSEMRKDAVPLVE